MSAAGLLDLYLVFLVSFYIGAAISQLVHIHLLDKIKQDWKDEEFKCELINITYAAPMVGNLPLRECLSEDVTGRMYHFVLAEDIVPAALFTEFAYQKLPTIVTKRVLRQCLGSRLDQDTVDAVDALQKQGEPFCETSLRGLISPPCFSPHKKLAILFPKQGISDHLWTGRKWGFSTCQF